MKRPYIMIHKKRLLHISIIVIVELIMIIGSCCLMFLIKGNTGDMIYKFIMLLCANKIFTWYWKEYRDWVKGKYPKSEKQNHEG